MEPEESKSELEAQDANNAQSTSDSKGGELLTTLSADSIPKPRTEGLSAERVGEEFALHDGATGKVHFLNETAAVVWDYCDGERSAAEVCAAVAEAYGQPAETVASAVMGVLTQLGAEGLLAFDA